MKSSTFKLFILTIFFISCYNKRKKVLSEEKCCMKMIHERKFFLDSLFIAQYPQRNKDSLNYYPMHINEVFHRSFVNYPANLYPPLNYFEWSSSQVIFNGLGEAFINGREEFDRNSGLIVQIFFNPNSICETLTERWIYFGNSENIRDYLDDYMVFDYQIKEDVLWSQYCDAFDLGIQSQEEINIENMNAINSKTDVYLLKNWFEEYINRTPVCE